MPIAERLAELGITLPEPPAPAANYAPWVRTGDLIFLSGHLPNRAGKLVYAGKIGADVSEEDGYEAAKLTTLNLLATLQAALGSLDNVQQIVKVTGFVNAAPGFTQQPKIINGCSDLLVAIFRERGRHGRAAVGAGDLPLGAAVEIELIAEVR